MHIFSKFNLYSMNAHTHTVIYQGKGTKENIFKKRKKQATTKEVLWLICNVQRVGLNHHIITILTSITSKLQSVGLASWQQPSEALISIFPASCPTNRIRSALASTRTMLMRLSAQNAWSSVCWMLHPTSSLTFPAAVKPCSSRHTITDSGSLEQSGSIWSLSV